MSWTKDNGKFAKDAAEQALLQANYLDEKKPLIDKFTDEQTNLQAQINQLVADGDSSPEAAQARVGVDDTEYNTLKARLDAENAQVTQQLVQKVSRDDIYSGDYTPPIKLKLNDFSGYNQPYHPSVLYLQEGFSGYKYWLVQTPLPVNGLPYRDRWECPVVYKSNDGIEWIIADNANPLDDLTPQEIAKMNFFSDPHLVYKNGSLEVWYRYSDRSTQNSDTMILRKTTTDGVNWSSREVMITSKPANSSDFWRSPSIIWSQGTQQYRCWYQNDYGIYYSASSDGLAWGAQQQIALDTPHDSWHIDVNYYDGYYHLLSYSANRHNIAYYKSTDGINFSFVRILFDVKDNVEVYKLGLYRACSIMDGDGKVRVYSSATTSENKTAIFVVVADSIEEIDVFPKIKNNEKFGRVKVEDINTYTALTPSSAIARGFVTQNVVTFSEAIGTPNNIGGLLVSDATAADSSLGDSLVYQTFYERSVGLTPGKIYARNSLGTDGAGWGNWFQINAPFYTVVVPDDTYSTSTPYTSFPVGKITRNIVSNAQATNTPNQRGGLLVTDYTSAASREGDVLVLQTFYERPVGSVSNVYFRKTTSSEPRLWTEWEVLNKPNTEWFGKTQINTTFRVVSNLKVSNYVNFDALHSEGGITPTLSKTLWSQQEISSDANSPTTIASTGNHALQIYKNADNNLLIRYDTTGNNYPIVLKLSAF